MNEPEPMVIEHVPGTHVYKWWGTRSDTEGWERMCAAVKQLQRIAAGADHRNIHHRLKDHRQTARDILPMLDLFVTMNESLEAENEMLRGNQVVGKRRRWTDDEDEALIELAGSVDVPDTISLAMTFNRTPAAIMSRINYLVGRKRLTQHVAGRITGYVDGVPVEDVFIDGEVKR